MFAQLDLTGVRLSLMQQLLTRPQLHAASRRRRTLRRRRLGTIVRHPYRMHLRHG
jgi:hypothetical protein